MGYLGDSSTHYFIPGIGIYNLNIEKAEYVKILYDFLSEVGEIDRLKNLDHLGIVREVIDGARHSRFDYIALIFALMDNWVQKVEEIHASSGKAKGKNLIKCWALLFNIGHLEWTFFTERILLEVLCEEELHTKFIESIESEKIRKKAKKIFEFNDYNHFYQILAYLRFKCLCKEYEKCQNGRFEKYKQMFEEYFVDDFSDKVEKGKIIYSKSLYRTVRNIAFLLLDSFYTPSGLNLSPVLIFDNPELIRSIVFGETEISNILKFINRQLYKSVYLNEKVLAIQSLYYEHLKGKLKGRVKCLKKSKDICDFVKKIYDELRKDIEDIKRKVKSESKHVPIMRFEFEADDFNEQLKEKEKLDKPSLKAGCTRSSFVEVVNSNCYRVVWKTPLNFYVIQYNSKSDKRSSITAFKESFDTVRKFLKGMKDKYTFDKAKFDEAKKLLEDLRHKFRETDCTKSLIKSVENRTKSFMESIENIENKYGEASYIEHKRDVIEKIAKKYIEQALKLFFNSKDVRWEWDHTSFLRSYFNFPDAVIGFADDVIKFYEKNIISKFNERYNEIRELYEEKVESVKKELEAKLKVVGKLKEGEESIKGKPDILCITISNLNAYLTKKQQSMNEDYKNEKKDQSTEQLTEIDGIILGLTTEKQLFICLVEAKSGKRDDAVKDLKSRICNRRKDILGVYDISKVSNLMNSVKGLDNNSIAYLIITDEKIPTI